jgi:hypothetical protein
MVAVHAIAMPGSEYRPRPRYVARLFAKIGPVGGKKDGFLTVAIQQGKDLRKPGIGIRRDQRFEPKNEFPNIINGQLGEGGDTDSAQVAVLWTNNDNKYVGDAANATFTGMARGKKGAAKWTIDKQEGKNQPGEVSWQTEVPKGATHMLVVVVYTDILFGTPAQANAVQGDLPAVIGSWSGNLKNGNWNITINAGDLFQPLDGYPSIASRPGLLQKARSAVTKTGYNLVARPDTLEGIFAPSKQMSQKAIEALLQAAVNAKKIDSIPDTGFDLLRPSNIQAIIDARMAGVSPN